MIKDLDTLESKLKNIKLLVIGDCILDRYFIGEVNRISPEAPVPIFDLKDIYYSLGGAANVAANLRGLNVSVELIGVLGKDGKAKIFKNLAKDQKIGIKGLIEDTERPTTIKTRVIAQSQQLLRIDKEKRKTNSKDYPAAGLRRARAAIAPTIITTTIPTAAHVIQPGNGGGGATILATLTTFI